jgi:hypothetical protein
LGSPPEKIKREAIQRTLAEVTNHRGKAAKLLGLSLLTPQYKIKDTVSGTHCSVTYLRPFLSLSEVHSQILRMSEHLIARQALDHASFLQELQRPHACEEPRSANNAEGAPAAATQSALLCTPMS